MKTLDYIFLDLDGPVLDGRYRHYACYMDILELHGGKPLALDIYWALKRNKVTRDVILEKSDFKGSYDLFFKEWLSNIEKKKYLQLDRLKPNVIETILAWKSIADKISLVTMRQDRSALLSQLGDLGILSLFDEVIDCPPKIRHAKYKALKSKSFNRAIFIGDTEEDTKTAKMLDIFSIGITNGLRSFASLDADYYFEEIADIDFDELAFI